MKMATLPHFSFPPVKDLDIDFEAASGRNSLPPPPNLDARPHIQLQTRTNTPASGNRLAVPTSQFSQPEPYTLSPPNTPTEAQLHAAIMATGDFPYTPPSTPVGPSHSASSSISSIAGSLSSLRRGDSTSSHTNTYRQRNNSIGEDDAEEPGSKELRVFKYWISDYEIKEKDKKKPLGSGLWSDVYLASPCPPTSRAVPSSTSAVSTPISIMTPPITPVKSRTYSRELASPSGLYAIKHPASKAAKAVLGAEAKILSYLSRFPDSESHTVPFYGQDLRNEALVLKALDTTLESYIQKELNSLSEPARAQKLALVFPTLARDLISGLEWLEQHGIVHADIKPANVLLNTSSSPCISALYSDFSSSLFLTPDASPSSAPTAPLGGGTWDYLDPLLLSSKSPTKPTPSPQSDLWSLAVTLLTVVIGSSPFDGAGNNVFRRREMVKQGAPLSYVGYGDEGLRNIARLRGLGKGWAKWFEKVLVKDAGRRVGIEVWREEFERLA
jgi:hypothetical protein